MHIKRVILLAWIFQGVAAPRPPAATVAGIALKAGSLEPLSDVLVKLQKTDSAAPANELPRGASGSSGGRISQITTSTDGKFTFQNVQPGSYRLSFSRAGYALTDYPQTLTITEGRAIENIQGILPPGGSITGRFLDTNGDPLIKAEIQALQYSYPQGRRVLAAVQTSATNDLGEYRLFWLQPGSYLIRAMPADPSIPSGVRFPSPGDLISVSSTGITVRGPQTVSRRIESGGGVVEEIAVPVYYPGTTDAGSATSVAVRAAETVSGVNLTAARARVYSVHGKVIDGPTGKPVAAQLAAASPNATSGFGPPRDITNDGSFAMKGLLAGSYSILAAAGTIQNRITGRTPITVGNKDIDNIIVTLWPDFRINGKVLIEGDIPRASGNGPQPNVEISIESDLESNAGSLYFKRGAAVAPGSEFSLSSVFPGDYQVSVTPALPGNLSAYVKSIRFGSIDVIRDRLRVETPTSDTLEIVLSLNPASVEGDVVNSRQAPAPNATVALIPNDRRRAIDFKSVTSDASGHFVLKGVAPGEYKVFAWENIEANSWRDPDFIAPDEVRGISIRLSEGIRENISKIVIIPSRSTP